MFGVYIDVRNYLDGNGVELYRDRSESEWPRTDSGDLSMISAPLDLDALLAEAQ